nr:class I SAM-dependent methyltransferase [Streptomyces sp. NBC_00830]
MAPQPRSSPQPPPTDPPRTHPNRQHLASHPGHRLAKGPPGPQPDSPRNKIFSGLLAARGAWALGIDPFPRMIEHAQAATKDGPPGAHYAVDDGCTLATVATCSVDWVTAGLSLNNVPDLSAALTAVRRVLVPGGHLAFTIPHPCFEAPHTTWTDREQGRPRRVVGDYHAEGFWRSDNPQGVRRAGNQHRMLSTYLNALGGHGFLLETAAELTPSSPVAAEQPQRAGLPPFFLVRASSKK